MLDKYWWINYRMNEWWKAIPSREPEVYVWLGFLPNLQLVFRIGTDDTPRSISFPRFYAYKRFWSLMGPWSPAKFFSDAEVKWLSLCETEQWWMDSGRDSDDLPFWLARWLPSVCSRITDGMSFLLRLQSVLVYKSKNSCFPQWIRKGQKSF